MKHKQWRTWIVGVMGGVVLCGVFGVGAAVGAGGVEVIKGVSYVSGEALSDYERERCKVDLYVPEGADGATVLVWFHGGSLRSGDKGGDIAVGIGERFSQEGVIVVSINYRLSPKATYPAYLIDAGRAVAWTVGHAKAYGGDPSKVFVSGHSAGGYLAAMVGVDARWMGAAGSSAELIAGLMPVSGQMVTHSTVRAERGIPKTQPVIDEAAPSYHVRSDAPPVLLLCGSEDLAMRAEENHYFYAALRAAGHKKNAYLNVAGRTHGTIANRIPEAGDAVAAAMLEFMKGHGGR